MKRLTNGDLWSIADIIWGIGLLLAVGSAVVFLLGFHIGMPAQAWVTLVVGALAAIGVIVTWQQKNRADRRSEWWRRMTWAFERTFSDDSVQAELGWKMVDTLVRSRLATPDDSDIVRVVAVLVSVGPGDLQPRSRVHLQRSRYLQPQLPWYLGDGAMSVESAGVMRSGARPGGRTTMATLAADRNPAVRSFAVRIAAANAAVAASEKAGRPVDPRVEKLLAAV